MNNKQNNTQLNNKQKDSHKRRRMLLFPLWIVATIILCAYATFLLYEPNNPDSLLVLPFFLVFVLPLSIGLMFLFEWMLKVLFPVAHPSKSKARASLLCGILSIVFPSLISPFVFLYIHALLRIGIIMEVIIYTSCLFFSVLGIILSRRARKDGYVGGVARAGFVCSIIGIALIVGSMFSAIIIRVFNIDVLLLEMLDVIDLY